MIYLPNTTRDDRLNDQSRRTVQEYSAIRHLASTLRIDFATGLVCMITGYFDESGTHDQALVTTVAGFVSTPKGWATFDEYWQRVLDEFGLTAFHMKECAHCTGEFAKFENNEPDRKSLLAALATVIKKTCLFGCGIHVIREHHAMLNADNRLGSPYSLAAHGCMALASNWMKGNKIQTPLDMLFERGSEFSKGFTRELEETEAPSGVLNDFGTIAFGAKDRFLGLQAADFLAYEQCKFFTDCVRDSRSVKPRMTLRMLKCVPSECKLLDIYELGNLLITLIVNDLRQAGEI